MSLVKDVYASHLPVLRSLLDALPIQTVLEFGGGEYSTAEWLSRPQVTVVRTVEVDPGWRAFLLDRFAGDDRLWVTNQYDGPLTAYDLIFIDDGQNAAERVKTINRVAWEEPRGMVVIHDFEVAAYREAARFEHVFVSTNLRPYTGGCWNGNHPEWEDVWKSL